MTSQELTAGSIVVAYDGSRHAERALEWATDQAEREHRTLDLVNAIDAEGTLAAVWATSANASAVVVQEAVRDAARSLLDSAVVGVRARHDGLEVRGHLLEGADPRDLLVEASRSAHLLVLGSRGRGTVRSLLLGSVSAAVTRHATCPVVVARPRPDHGSVDVVTDGIVVGADGTPDSLPVIEFAFRQASLTSLRLTVVHCYRDVIAGAGFLVAVPTATETEDLRVVLGQSIAGMAEKFPDVEVTSQLQRGLTDQALTRSGHPWALIVVGRHHKTAWQRALVGSVARSVLEHARTTVAVVPEATTTGHDRH